MIPKLFTSKWREGIGGISDEASGCMGIQSQHERDEKMVRVPEGLVGLLADTMMRGRIHQQHAEKHDMACDTGGLGVMNLNRKLGPDLIFLDIIKAASG